MEHPFVEKEERNRFVIRERRSRISSRKADGGFSRHGSCLPVWILRADHAGAGPAEERMSAARWFQLREGTSPPKIAAAQRARWAKVRPQKKTA